MPKKWPFFCFCQFLFLVVCLTIVPAGHTADHQPTAPAPASPKNHALTPEALEQQIAILDQKIKLSLEAENTQTALQLGVDLALLQKRTTFLKDLRDDYVWWVMTLERIAELEKEKTAIGKKLQTLKERGIKEPPPYSLAFYEDLLSRLQGLKRQQESQDLNSAIFYESLDSMKKERDEAEKKCRLLQNELAAGAPELTKKVRFELELALLEKEGAEKEILSAQTYEILLKLLRELVDPQVEVYRDQVAWVRKNLVIGESDLDQQLALLNRKQEQIEARRAEIQQLKREKNKMWDKAMAAAESGADNRLQEEIAQDRQTWRQAYHASLDCLCNRLSIIDYEETLCKYSLNPVISSLLITSI